MGPPPHATGESETQRGARVCEHEVCESEGPKYERALQLTPPCILYRSTACFLSFCHAYAYSGSRHSPNILVPVSPFFCSIALYPFDMCHALFHLLSAFIPTALVFLGVTTLFITLTSLTLSSYKTPPPEAEGCQCLWVFSTFSVDAVFHLNSGRLEPFHVVGPPFLTRWFYLSEATPSITPGTPSHSSAYPTRTTPSTLRRRVGNILTHSGELAQSGADH